MTERRSAGHDLVAGLLLLGSLTYLSEFVVRGWVPHDEGMLGLSAEWVSHGALPHVDYLEPYTGGLSWLHAGVYRLVGPDLANIRRLLFLGAVIATWLTYTLLRRCFGPIGAAAVTCLTIVWSFPNYFAGVPSWWVLICALGVLWTSTRYIETRRLTYVLASGVCCGLAIAFKQTGLYVLAAAVLFHVYDAETTSGWQSLLRKLAAIVSILATARVLGPRLLAAEGVFLFLPIAACAGLIISQPSTNQTGAGAGWVPLLSVLVGASLPIGALLYPYVVGHHLTDFFNGAFVLPGERLQFASLRMLPWWLVLLGLPLALVLPLRKSSSQELSRPTLAALWTTALALPIAATQTIVAYQFLWQSARAFAALLPIAICWRIISTPGQVNRRQLYLVAVFLSMFALNQFPYAGAIYFGYVTPLVIIGTAFVGEFHLPSRRRLVLPWATAAFLFAVLSLNRSPVSMLGRWHEAVPLDTPLDLPGGHLRVSGSDAQMYRRIVEIIAGHVGRGTVVAGPDCPEVAYLAGKLATDTRFFEFLDPHRSYDDRLVRRWAHSAVVVINHGPLFSPALPEAVVSELRATFPGGENVGRFEVRWRQ